MVLCFNKVKGEGNGVTMDEMMAKRAMLALESLGSVVITDAEGRYIYVSAQRLRKGGYQLEDLIGKYVRDVYPDTLVDQVLQTRQPVFLCPLLTPTLYGVQQNFVSYYPLVDGNECLGCFLYTTFGGMNSALEFTHIVTELSREVAQTRKQLQSIQKKSANYTTADIIGQSPAINQLKREISMVARTCSNVLIQGETGTGKELVAHSIHNLSRRCGAPFLRVNCSAIPEHLMESEFFGYEEGAFTGAKRGGKAGKFERASGGSLFLDEVNTLPMNMQPKFLRVIQEGEVERVGGGVSIPIDTRIISATNSPLEELVRLGEFRQDLYYRLNVVRIVIPPLRERKEDIPLLVDMFISQLNVRMGLDIQAVQPQVLELLMEHDWPGNVRELQNVVERAMNYAYEGVLTPSHFRFFQAQTSDKTLSNSYSSIPLNAVPSIQDYRAAEYARIHEALICCGGNKSAAAKSLGWARSTFYEKLKKMRAAERFDKP